VKSDAIKVLYNCGTLQNVHDKIIIESHVIKHIYFM